MAGRGHKKQSIAEYFSWKAGLYARRSFDDLDDKESNTIVNQKSMSLEKVKEYPDIEIEEYYIDDGYSGTTFDRPSFKEMLKDVVNGKINCIIVKDLSRLGRNYIEVGKYIEDVFPLYNVRFISINDNIDSFKDPESVQNISVAVKNLINDEYAKDISKKVKSAYVTMAKNGKFVSGTPPYGYNLDPEDKHHLIVNNDEAEIVRKIFEMTINGLGRIKICKYLNDNGILCRKELQRRIKRKLTLEPFEIESRYRWSTTQIGRILKNETYLGHLVQCKTGNVSYKIHKLVEKPKEEWIVVENTHEAIIDEKIFKKAQKHIRENKYNITKESEYSIFNRKLHCADCGRAMYKQTDTRGNRKCSNFYCSNYMRTGKICSPHKIQQSVLDKIVMEAIQLQVKLVIELEKTINKLNLNNNLVIKNYEYDIKSLEKKISSIKENKKLSYEEWKFNKIDKNKFVDISNNCDLEIDRINKEIETINVSYLEYKKNMKKNNYWIEHYKRNRKIKKLTKEVIDELIESIQIYENSNIKITFKYNDEYMALLSYINKESDKNE